ncbi:MAG: Sugar phosphate permease [Verrucomicrobiaceae bacterium]|nr:Sugar phosphate permease [Verrucomicrobiaceae bacterium]
MDRHYLLHCLWLLSWLLGFEHDAHSLPSGGAAAPGHGPRATGYGILNFFSCCIGGIAAYLGGWLKERQVDLSILLMGSAVGVLISGLLLALVKPKRRA